MTGAALAGAIAAAALGCTSALAQPIVRDGTTSTLVTSSGGNFQITGGNLAGANLFHSFTTFGIPSGRTATFSGASSVQNIISRVTGSDPSAIDGTLASTIAGANFYLINPHGVSFGANAHLNVSGSVYVAAADYLRLGSDRFDAVPPGVSSFSSAPPSAFGFLGPTAGISAAAATLGLPNGATLSLAGNGVALNGTSVTAFGGRMNLASLAGTGEMDVASGAVTGGVGGVVTLTNALVNLGSSSSGLAAGAFNVRSGSLAMSGTTVRSQNSAAQKGGDFTASVDGDLSISGGFVQFENSGTGGAGDALLSGTSISIGNNGSLSTATLGPGAAGSITLAGSESVSVTSAFTRIASGSLTPTSGIAGAISFTAPSIMVDQAVVDASTASAAHAGDITLDAARLTISNHGRVFTNTSGPGNAGLVTVRASESVTVTGINTGSSGDHGGLYSRTIGFNATGNAGTIRVETPVLAMDAMGEITSTSELGGGNAGMIVIRAGQLTMANGARISTTTFSSGHGGVLDVQVTDSIDISGKGANGEQTALRSNSQSSGEAGAILVQTHDLTIHDSGLISSEARGSGPAGAITVRAANVNLLSGGTISTNTMASGDAGAVTVIASDTVRISGIGPGPTDFSGITSNSLSPATGSAGAITVVAPKLIMDQTGTIQSVTETSGNGGNIDVRVGQLSLTTGAQITSTTSSAGASGSISLVAADSVTISGDTLPFASGLYTSSQGPAATGPAGPIFVQAGRLLITNSGGITSNTDGPAPAGSVTVVAGDIRLEQGGGISASTAGSGPGGTLRITATGTVSIDGMDAEGNSSGFFTRSDGSGAGGKIDVKAANLLINGFSGISSESGGTGNAGEILVDVSGSLRINGGIISTQATSASGGSITIHARDLVYVKDGGIVTEVATGGGNGGNIFIDPTFVVLDNGVIRANAIDGNGGNITIVADNFLNSFGEVSASSRTGISGNIVIRSPVVDTTGALVQLSNGFLDLSKLMRESCAAQAGRDSRFLAAPRGGLAAAPENERAPRGALPTSSSQIRSSCPG